mgnify:CR=1 FL=1
MNIPEPRYRCPLDRSSHRTDPDVIKREGWREQSILVIAANDERLDFVEREFVRQLGERLYGEKQHG